MIPTCDDKRFLTRVLQIFRKVKNLQRIRIGWNDILWPILFLGGINVALLMTWNIQDPAEWVRAPVEEPTYFLDPEEVASFGSCDSEHFRIYFGTLVSINYVFSLVTLVQAYECRKISTDYAESFWITFSLGCIVQVWTIGLPLLKLLENDPLGVFIVKVVVVFLTTMCPLMMIFVPKIDYAHEARVNVINDHENEAIPHGDHSITSNNSESSPTKDLPFYGRLSGRNLSEPTEGKRNPPAGPKGIRVIQNSNHHVEKVETLQRSLRHAESRNRSLNDRLERLQEKLELYVVTRRPHTDFHDGDRSVNNSILTARSENVVLHPLSRNTNATSS
jgi:7 transmembrane sweet-taste receptor of 3 GCPR